MPDVVDPDLTPTWIAIYEAIRQHWIKFGAAPSQGEVMKEIGCSTASVQNAYKNLLRRGHVIWQKGGERTIRPVDLDRRIYKVTPDPWATLAEKEPWEA